VEPSTSRLSKFPGMTGIQSLHMSTRLRVLCVDDEPNILEGLRLNLDRVFDMHTAGSGAQALALLEREEPFAVVVSDMRMPEMDGAEFLGRVRERFRDTVRILLTGYADVGSAISAINNGQIFRFLTKPCPPSQVLLTLREAASQYRLIETERVLLDKTLHGTIRALTDVLALVHPLAFGRALRLHKAVSAFAGHIDLKEAWQVEVAAMLSQIGCMTLTDDTIEKLHLGQDLSTDEADKVRQASRTAVRLIGEIPRLEGVRGILGGPREDGDAGLEETIRVGEQMLRIVSDYDSLEARGLMHQGIISIMRSRKGRYDGALLTAFAQMHESDTPAKVAMEVSARSLRAGMVLLDDLFMSNGTLLAARGYEITEQFMERASNWRRGAVREPIRVTPPLPLVN
jgi:response regulator RpfG family c-di-GMP phosphodiesterase